MGRRGGSFEMDKKSGKVKSDRGGLPVIQATREMDTDERLAKKMKERAALAKKQAAAAKTAGVSNA